jgi:hypothetical protein
MEADIVSVVHVAPKANRDFATGFTSPSLARHGGTVTAAWSDLAPKGRFTAIPSESLLTAIEPAAGARYYAWTNWLLARYGWWRGHGADMSKDDKDRLPKNTDHEGINHA